MCRNKNLRLAVKPEPSDATFTESKVPQTALLSTERYAAANTGGGVRVARRSTEDMPWGPWTWAWSHLYRHGASQISGLRCKQIGVQGTSGDSCAVWPIQMFSNKIQVFKIHHGYMLNVIQGAGFRVRSLGEGERSSEVRSLAQGSGFRAWALNTKGSMRECTDPNRDNGSLETTICLSLDPYPKATRIPVCIYACMHICMFAGM